MIFIQKNNIRNLINIFLKVNSEDYNKNKLSSIISQYGIEDAQEIDIYLNLFFEKKKKFFLNNSDDFFNFYIPISIFIDRDEKDTDISIFSCDLKRLFSLFFDKKIVLTKFNNFLLLNLGMKFDNNYYIYFLFLQSRKGFLKSFRNRDKLKNRKINFRRKIKKNLYEE